jgi:hypothetical protein
VKNWLLIGLILLIAAGGAFAGDVSGKWKFAIQMPDGSIEVPVTLKVKGEDVTAETAGIEITGTLKGDQLELTGEMYADKAGYEAPVKVSGRVKGDEIRGDASWDIYETSFIATKSE